MKKKIVAGFFITAICFAFFCCKQEKSEFADEILSTVKQNAEALNNEDIDSYMATLHEDSPAYESTKEKLTQSFEQFDLSISVEELNVVEASGEEAKVEFVQVTKSGGSSEFNDNRMKGVHLLRKVGGEWKIYKTEIRNIDYL